MSFDDLGQTHKTLEGRRRKAVEERGKEKKKTFYIWKRL